MNVPVYELHDGESIAGFIKTTTATIEPTRNGIRSAITRTTLRRVKSRYGYTRRELPVNYKTISKAQAIKALEDSQYNWLHVSIHGDNIIKHFNLEDKRYGTS